jgi:hypothetical protein
VILLSGTPVIGGDFFSQIEISQFLTYGHNAL